MNDDRENEFLRFFNRLVEHEMAAFNDPESVKAAAAAFECCYPAFIIDEDADEISRPRLAAAR